MNIFMTSTNPQQAARDLDDKRVVKMVLETAQLLATNHNLLMGRAAGIYRTTHANHPCTIWVRSTVRRYKWTIEYFKALAEEYTFRYGKVHASWEALGELVQTIPEAIPLIDGPLKPVNCTPYPYSMTVEGAYKLTLTNKWREDKRPPTWTKRAPPAWYADPPVSL